MGHSLCVAVLVLLVVVACGHRALCERAGAVRQVDRDIALVSAAGPTCSYIHIKGRDMTVSYSLK